MQLPPDFVQYLQGLSPADKLEAYKEIRAILGLPGTATDENLRMAYKEYSDEVRHFSATRSALTVFLVTASLTALAAYFNKSQSNPFLAAAASILSLAAILICLVFSWRTSQAFLRRKRIWQHFTNEAPVAELEQDDFPGARESLKAMRKDSTNWFLAGGLFLIWSAFWFSGPLKRYLPVISDPPPPVSVLLNKTILFDPNEARLDTKASQTIQKIAESARTNPDAIVLLWSHTDTTGAAVRNRQLAQLRSIAVRERLVAGGVMADHIFASDLANASLPVATGSPEAEPWNRSVDVEVRHREVVAPVKPNP